MGHYGLTFSVTLTLTLTWKAHEVRGERYIRADMTLQLCTYAIVFITADVISLGVDFVDLEVDLELQSD